MGNTLENFDKNFKKKFLRTLFNGSNWSTTMVFDNFFIVFDEFVGDANVFG